MDRIALSLIAAGLLTILAVIAVVMGGSHGQMTAAYAALAASLAGGAIVGGLALLERRGTGSALREA